MKNIRLVYAFVLVFLTLLWLMAEPDLLHTNDFYGLRALLINYSGMLAIGVMSVGMMLGVRPARIEPVLGGLDKSYRLHKWLGATALALAITHWLWTQASGWLRDLGWLGPKVRKPAVEQTVALLNYFQNQRGFAKDIGEWAFYCAVLLIVLALLKRFPYRYFFKTHRLLAVAYLALATHSVLLMKFDYWGQAIGPVMALLVLGGTIAALISLLRKVGFQRRAVGVIDELFYHGDNRVLKVAVTLKQRWQGHQAGQFAFVTFDQREGPHPFTISSDWHGDGKLMFLIKGLGDYTSTLPTALKVGAVVKVEGPYGRFCFDDDQPCQPGRPRQIWVAGGIGITPFIARLQTMAHQPDAKDIDLFYSTSAPDAQFLRRVQQCADLAGIGLHVALAGKDPRLTSDSICALIPDWKDASVWFCGPAGFGQALRQGFVEKGLPADHFHQELFNMR
jgi:predicted ferric reductase